MAEPSSNERRGAVDLTHHLHLSWFFRFFIVLVDTYLVHPDQSVTPRGSTSEENIICAFCDGQGFTIDNDPP